MAYVTYTDYETYSGETLDASVRTWLTDTVIPEGEQFIERLFGYTFVSGAAADKKHHAITDVRGRRLIFKTWAAAAPTAITCNSVAFTDYVLLGDSAPYWGVELKQSTDESWLDYGDDPEEAINVNAQWGYSVSAPVLIKKAIFLYIQSRLKNRSGEQRDWLRKEFYDCLSKFPAEFGCA